MIITKNSGGYYRDGVSITQEEYERIQGMIRNRPTAPEGFVYRLTDSLEWELTEAPQIQHDEAEATAADYQAALAQIGVMLNGN